MTQSVYVVMFLYQMNFIPDKPDKPDKQYEYYIIII